MGTDGDRIRLVVMGDRYITSLSQVFWLAESLALLRALVNELTFDTVSVRWDFVIINPLILDALFRKVGKTQMLRQFLYSTFQVMPICFSYSVRPPHSFSLVRHPFNLAASVGLFLKVTLPFDPVYLSVRRLVTRLVGLSKCL